MLIDKYEIHDPTLIVNEDIARANIAAMISKAEKSNVIFRPHFKTHQSASIGSWFKDAGIDKITVSSLKMAYYFANSGWKDITVAVPVNLLEIDLINDLASKINLNLLVDNPLSFQHLELLTDRSINIWIKIDVGYRRAGIPWDDQQRILDLALQIQNSKNFSLCGVLTHSGHTYAARNIEEIKTIYTDTLNYMNSVKSYLRNNGIDKVAISIGDTPSMSTMPEFENVDEIRPGNFVFYDLMQANIGSCNISQIAVALACPITGIYPARGEICIYGGGVHLSKERVNDHQGNSIYGLVSFADSFDMISKGPLYPVISVSQEHGIVKLDPETLSSLKPGDVCMVLPIHSCMTANLMKYYLSSDGERIEKLN